MEKEFKNDDWCRSFDIDKDAATLAVACDSSGVSVWSMRDQKQVAQIKTDSDACDVRFNRSENEIGVGCEDGEIYKITL